MKWETVSREGGLDCALAIVNGMMNMNARKRARYLKDCIFILGASVDWLTILKMHLFPEG